MINPTAKQFDALITINSSLNQLEAAQGLLIVAKDAYHFDIDISWYEKLQKWFQVSTHRPLPMELNLTTSNTFAFARSRFFRLCCSKTGTYPLVQMYQLLKSYMYEVYRTKGFFSLF